MCLHPSGSRREALDIQIGISSESPYDSQRPNVDEYLGGSERHFPSFSDHFVSSHVRVIPSSILQSGGSYMMAAIGRAACFVAVSTTYGTRGYAHRPGSRRTSRSSTQSWISITRCCPATTLGFDHHDSNPEGSGPERCVNEAGEGAVLDLQDTATFDASLLTVEEESAGIVPDAVPSETAPPNPADDPFHSSVAMNPASKLPKDIPEFCGTPDCPDVVQALSSISWPWCDSRKNVSKEPIKAMCLGMSWNYSSRVASIPPTTKERPNLTKLLASFADRIPDPNFTYTCIQLNMDYNAMIHVDANNLGTSFIIGLGE